MNEGRRPAYLGALRSRPFARLLVAHGLATTAQLVLVLAVGVAVLERTGSGFWLSSVVALSFLPYALLSSLSGVLVDRSSRSRLVAASSAVRAVLALGVAVACWGGGSVPLVVALTAAAAVAATPSYPALAAATQQCVDRDHLPAANALATSVENGCWIAGPGVFGLLVAVGVPPPGIVLLCTGLLVVAALCAGSARLTPVPREPSGAWAELAVAAGAVVRTPAIRRPMWWAVLDNLLYGYLVVAVVVLAGRGDGGEGHLGLLNGALAVGAVVATLAVNRLVHGAGPALLPVTVVVFAASLALLGVAGAGVVGAVLVLVAGATTLVAEVAAVTALQDGADAGLLGRVMGLYDQVNVGAVAVGSFLAGPLAELVGARTALLAVGATAAVVALAGAVPALGWRADGRTVPPTVPPCPATSSSSPPSTSREGAPSSSSRVLPAQRRPSGTRSTRR